ncbi:MAG: phytoene/squalene synthase family protein [Leptolyngbya sp.]|nr:phytoene/squalene synthase family protein [Candidatus Melainabacteria bacterium]
MKAETKHHQLEAESIMMPNRAKTFAWAAQFLPKQTRKDFGVLYTFCRYVDDGVDHCSNKEMAARFLDQVSRDLEDNRSSDQEVAAFLTLARHRDIPLGFAFDLVRGVRTDIGFEQTESLEDLLRYSYQVAGTVGIMICYLLEVNGSDALAAAIDLGIGMQLTNIARDLREDFARGRIYLPADLIDRPTVAEALGGSLPAQARVVDVIKQVIVTSQTYYQSAENGICFLPLDTKLSILCAGRAYRQIGQLILKNPERIFNERVATHAHEKALCLISSLLSLSQVKFHRVEISASHESALHRPLKGLPSFDVACR